MNQGGIKHDTGKAPLSLMDRHAMEQIGAVLAFGAQKYAAHNWRGGIAYSRLLDAALRHLYAFADGEDLDPESGLPHIAHAGCCVVFLLGMMKHRPDMDDRWSTAAKLENALMSEDLTQTFGAVGDSESCGCRACAPNSMFNMRMILCEKCGNKRCPHANDHRNACTGSNEPGQLGSAYPRVEA